MSRKSARIGELLEQFRGDELNAHYLGFFACFNQQLFFEAHDVLEELWLSDRQSPNYAFFKGLIQLAGAFVHLQKNRLRPAAALFRLARANLERYPAVHEHLELLTVRGLIDEWLGRLEASDYSENPLETTPAPQISLLSRGRD